MPPLDLRDYSAPGAMPGFPSLVAVVLTSLVLAGLAIYARTMARRQRYRAWVAERTIAKPDDPLTVGYAVLSGTVELEGEEPAITVSIEQQGVETKNKHGWSTTWSETQRSVDARPFYLALATGERVRVEPDPDVMLVDDLDVVERRGADRIVRAAKLTAGEHATVSGQLTRGFNPRAQHTGYRQAEGGFLLVPAPGERMMVSAEPLADRYVRRATAHRTFSLVFAVAFAVATGLLYGTFHLHAVTGRAAQGERATASEHFYNTKNGRRVAYKVAYTARDGDRTIHEDEEVTYPLYVYVRDAQTIGAEPRIPVSVAWGGNTRIAGSRTPTVAIWRVGVVVGGTFLLAFIYWLRISSTLRWYDKPRVVHAQKGRLADEPALDATLGGAE